MAHYEGSYLVMSEDEIDALIERCQQPEVIQRRDAFFAELDQMGITRNPDGSVEVEFTPKPRSEFGSQRTGAQNIAINGLGSEQRVKNPPAVRTNWIYSAGILSAA